MSYQSAARRDLWEGVRNWRLWTTLGWQDIRQRYRRSVLGPAWLVLSAAIWIGSLGLMFGALFRMNMVDFFPYVAAGVIGWTLISQTVSEASAIFVQSKSIIESIGLPLSVQAYRAVFRNLIVYLHSLPILFIVDFLYPIPVNETLLLFPVGLALVAINGFWVSLLLGILGTRFRDLQQIVVSMIQVVFFMTPIFWKMELLGRHAYIVLLNPFYHFVEIIRAPLLGQTPALSSYAVVCGVTAIGFLAADAAFGKFRGRIHYWL